MSGVRDAVATMGAVLPDDVGGRDAVHVAVIAVVASQKLSPGEDVGVLHEQSGGDPMADPAAKPVGKVDPFLTKSVQRGQRFWLYLYPRTITGLNHSWTHPAFPDKLVVPSSQKLTSEQWIRNYAEEIGDGYLPLMAGADRWVSGGAYYYGPDQGGYHGLFEGTDTNPEFWDHYEVVRGVKVPEDKRERFFTCSC